jgi:hypothetical protein
MKKADMIKTIQEKDAKLYLQIKEHEQLFGKDSFLHKSSRSEWCSIATLMQALDIKSDYSLPEWEEAMKIAMEIRMVEQFEAEDFANAIQNERCIFHSNKKKVMTKTQKQKETIKRFLTFVNEVFPNYELNDNGDDGGRISFFPINGKQDDAIEFQRSRLELHVLNYANDQAKQDCMVMEGMLELIKKEVEEIEV